MTTSFTTYKQYRKEVEKTVQNYLNQKIKLEVFKDESNTLYTEHLERLKTDDNYLKSALVYELKRNYFWLNGDLNKTLAPLQFSASDFYQDLRLQELFWMAYNELIEDAY